MYNYFIYLAVMAGITYLIRMLPLVLVKEKIKNRYILSFLYYIPYSVLSVMTFPAVFYSTGNVISAFVGTIVALLLAFINKSLVTVAGFSALSVFVVELLTKIM